MQIEARQEACEQKQASRNTLSSGKKMRVDAARSWKMRRYCRRKPSEKDISFAPSPSPAVVEQN